MISSGEVEYCFVHTIESNSRKMITKRTKIAIRIWIESLFEPLCEGLTLDLETLSGKIHEFSDSSKECIPISSIRITNTSKIECYHSYGARHFCRTKESVSSFGEFSEIELETTTHGPDSSWLVCSIVRNLGVCPIWILYLYILRTNEVLKIGKSVFCCDIKEFINIWTVPRKILSDIIGWNRKGKCSSSIVSFRVDLEECLIDNTPFMVQF